MRLYGRVRKSQCTREAAYWRIPTGSSPQPALSFPAAALASPACGFQLRRSSCGGEWDAGVCAGEGEGAGLGTGQSVGRSGAGLDTWGGGTAMAGVCWGRLEQVAVTDETAAEGDPGEALSHFLRNNCMQYSDVAGFGQATVT